MTENTAHAFSETSQALFEQTGVATQDLQHVAPGRHAVGPITEEIQSVRFNGPSPRDPMPFRVRTTLPEIALK